MTPTSKILVVGSGGREHALCWHLVQKGNCVFNAPGSYAIEQEGVTCFSDDSTDSLLALAKAEKIDVVVIGPEAYLQEGLSDRLRTHGLCVVGPSKKAARLETSKSFSKHFCKKYGVPTPEAKSCTSLEMFANAIENRAGPFVVKASGLAAGKGVGIFSDQQDALLFAKCQFEQHSEVLLEDFISGPEISCFYLVRHNAFIYLGAAQDHKRLNDGDTGPNTGGMGAYLPAPFFDASLKHEIQEKILKPTLRGLQHEQLDYEGFLFLGIMVTASGPQLIEYNCRMGDPETQCLVMNWQEDVVQAFQQLDKTKQPKFLLEKKAVMNIVVAAKGYPDSPEKGFALEHFENSQAKVFHAATRYENGSILANGGRLLSFVVCSNDLKTCRDQILNDLQALEPKNKIHFRRDIGHQAL